MDIVLVCPACKNSLNPINSTLVCNSCNKSYPVVNNVPVLIDDENSVFSAQDYVPAKDTPVTGTTKQSLKQKLLKPLHWLQKVAPDVTLNKKAQGNYARFADIILVKNERPKVLVIGGRTLGAGMHQLVNLPIDFIETDVAFGPRAKVICDAHQLPFPANYFDGVIIQAVMEYLVDPHQCVAEIHRVLKDNMPVYAETPFMQPVHGREHDFMRFSMLGFISLFRNFKEVSSGVCVGTGSALGLSYKYFILSFSDKKIIRELLLIFAHYTGFIFKYFDLITINTLASFDGASGVFFLGTKSNQVLTNRGVIKKYRGMI